MFISSAQVRQPVLFGQAGQKTIKSSTNLIQQEQIHFAANPAKKKSRFFQTLALVTLPFTALLGAWALRGVYVSPSQTQVLNESCQQVMTTQNLPDCTAMIQEILNKPEANPEEMAWAINRMATSNEFSYQSKIETMINTFHQNNGTVAQAGSALGNSLLQDPRLPANLREPLETYLSSRPYTTYRTERKNGYRTGSCSNGSYGYCYGREEEKIRVEHGDAATFQATEVILQNLIR